MNVLTPQDRANEVAVLMKKQMAIGGSGLNLKLRRAGRMLPRHVRRDARVLADAAALSGNPKLQRFVDSTQVEKAHKNCVRYLNNFDKSKHRTDTLVSILSGVAAGLLIPAGLFVTVLVWRGYL